MIFNYNDKSVYYEIHGEGEPLVIFNGIMMSTKSWQQFIPAFSKQNKLILFDFLDQGQSEKLVDKSYRHELQVELVYALFKHLNLSTANIFGISYGGEIALQFALKYPTMVQRLLLFNTCARTSYWLEEIGNAWNKASGDGEAYYLTTIPVIYSPHFFDTHRQWMEERKKILIPLFSDVSFIEGMVRLTNSSVGYNVVDQLPALKIPTLIVGAEYDFVTPYYQQEEMYNLIEGASLVKIPNCGHASMYEQPKIFESLVLGFIQT